QRRIVRSPRKTEGAGGARSSFRNPLRYRDYPAHVGGISGRDVRAATRAICDCALGRKNPASFPWAGSIWDLPDLLVPAGGLVALRIGEQGAARLRNGAGPTRSSRYRPYFHFLGAAWPHHMF